MLDRPGTDEYFEFYRTYVAHLTDGDTLETLRTQGERIVQAFEDVPGHLETFAYAPGKWTVREVLGHVIDAERVFSYRALRIARADTTPMPGFDENEWAVHSNAGSRAVADLIDEFQKVRAGTLAMFAGFDPGVGPRLGTASGHPVSVRALAWILAGHAEHHLRLFEDRYSAAFASASTR